mmetsp:Transcript_5104/g.15012  ORF Transcript_5104/g.15012 Transcript_5104/m.15012 type:complete len:566 (-) Transcript_5104:124-1821(-)
MRDARDLELLLVLAVRKVVARGRRLRPLFAARLALADLRLDEVDELARRVAVEFIVRASPRRHVVLPVVPQVVDRLDGVAHVARGFRQVELGRHEVQAVLELRPVAVLGHVLGLGGRVPVVHLEQARGLARVHQVAAAVVLQRAGLAGPVFRRQIVEGLLVLGVRLVRPARRAALRAVLPHVKIDRGRSVAELILVGVAVAENPEALQKLAARARFRRREVGDRPQFFARVARAVVVRAEVVREHGLRVDEPAVELAVRDVGLERVRRRLGRHVVQDAVQNALVEDPLDVGDRVWARREVEALAGHVMLAEDRGELALAVEAVAGEALGGGPVDPRVLALLLRHLRRALAARRVDFFGAPGPVVLVRGDVLAHVRVERRLLGGGHATGQAALLLWSARGYVVVAEHVWRPTPPRSGPRSRRRWLRARFLRPLVGPHLHARCRRRRVAADVVVAAVEVDIVEVDVVVAVPREVGAALRAVAVLGERAAVVAVFEVLVRALVRAGLVLPRREGRLLRRQILVALEAHAQIRVRVVARVENGGVRVRGVLRDGVRRAVLRHGRRGRLR